MAAAEARKLLGETPESPSTGYNGQPNVEQLMGDEAMNGTSVNAPKPKMRDSNVCRSFIVGTCPHDAFTNTKQDFGACPKVHVEALKVEYEALPESDKRALGFEFDYLRDMAKYIGECDHRISVAQRRLEKTPEEIRQTKNLVRRVLTLLKPCSNTILVRPDRRSQQVH
jgi:hypothetical protein